MKDLKRRIEDKNIVSMLKHPLFLIFLINIVIRIPYFSQPQGDDAFVVIWMAKAMQNGFLDVWLMNPLSLFGFNPYSVYPIGGLIVLSFFLKLDSVFSLQS